MDLNKRKKLVTVFDLISLIFGICGTCLGILSILALETSWKNLTTDDGAANSLIVTCVTLGVDITSCAAAFVSYLFGRQIYKTINFNDVDPVGLRLAQHEKNSYEFDKASFLIGIVGLCFGLTSLLTITPWDIKLVSVIVTYFAIVLDFSSSLMIVFALVQMMKYENVKSFVRMAKESMKIDRKRNKKKSSEAN